MMTGGLRNQAAAGVVGLRSIGGDYSSHEMSMEGGDHFELQQNSGRDTSHLASQPRRASGRTEQ